MARRAGLPDTAVVAGTQPLSDFAALLSEAGVVISADTGAAHLASAYARPSVVLFGPATPEQWGPPPGPHIVLTRPELRRGDVFAAEPDPALLGVSVQDALAALRELAGSDRLPSCSRPWSRTRTRERRRETCICETPNLRPSSAWLSSQK